MAEKKDICVIIGSAPVAADAFQSADRGRRFIICADGGYDNAVLCGIRPDLLVGDFDSVRAELPKDVEQIRLKTEKDDTDLFSAVKEGMHRGFRRFELYGALGGERMDHSYANFCVLQYLASQGCKAMISDGDRSVFLMDGGRLTLSKMKGRTVSVFPFGCASCEVTYSGLKYPMEQALLESAVPLGVSNLVTEDTAQITVTNGDAIVFVEK